MELLAADPELGIEELSVRSAIREEDVVATLQHLQLVQYWKGRPQVAEMPERIEAHLAKSRAKELVRVDPKRLVWMPHARTDSAM